jgi:hypothetical protein
MQRVAQHELLLADNADAERERTTFRLGRVFNSPVLFLGVGLPADRFHAPNERMVMDQFWKGLLAAGELWGELARG